MFRSSIQILAPFHSGRFHIFYSGVTFHLCNKTGCETFILYQEHIKSYYFDTRNLSLRQPTLTHNQTADVCHWCRFLVYLPHLNYEQGKSVIVLESARVGFGASGRSGGQAINGFEDGMDDYITQVGFENACKLWEMSLEAIDIIDERICNTDIFNVTGKRICYLGT